MVPLNLFAVTRCRDSHLIDKHHRRAGNRDRPTRSVFCTGRRYMSYLQSVMGWLLRSHLSYSLSTAIIVTRVTTSESTSAHRNQLRAPQHCYCIRHSYVSGCIPEMPHFIFLSMGGVLAVTSYFLEKSLKDTVAMRIAYKRKLQQKRTEILKAKSWTGLTLNKGSSWFRDRLWIDSINRSRYWWNLALSVRGIRKKLSSEIGLVNPIYKRQS